MSAYSFSAGAWLFPDQPVDKLVRIAQVLDESGFEYVWISDEGLNRDCYVAMAAILLATKRLKVGTGITNPYSRNPAVSAAAIATLDELSGGRAFLGYGPGGYLNLSPMGLHWDHPLTALREAIQIGRLLFSGQQVDFTGQLFQLHAASLSYARPDVEIHLAGRGRQVLELGGELCDGVLVSGKAKADLATTMDHIHSGAARGNNRPKTFYAAHLCFDEASLERSRAAHAVIIRNSPQQVKDEIGFTPEIERQVADAIDRGGIGAAASFISDAMLHEFVYAGDKDAVAAGVRAAMRKHGMAVFIPYIDSSLDLAAVQELASVAQLAMREQPEL